MIKHLPVCTLLGLGSLLPLGALAQEPAVEVPRTTPLTKAIRLEQYAEAAKHLSPQLVNQPDAGKYHPLTYAAFTGNTTLMESLIKAGADVNRVEHNGKTALYVAAREGNPDAVKLLIKHGAKYPDPDNHFQPAKAAVISKSTQALSALLSSYPKIDINACWPKSHPERLNTIGSAINYAALHGLNDIGILLINHGVDLTTPRNQRHWNRSFHVEDGYNHIHHWQGEKALQIAAENPDCSLELVKALVKAGCDPFEKTSSKHFQRRTPLDFAAASGSLEKFKFFMEFYDEDNKDHYYALNRAYFIAAAWKREKIVQFFLEFKNTEITDPESWLLKYSKPNTSQDNDNKLLIVQLQQLLPLPTKKEPQRIHSHVAVIAEEGLENTASIVTSILSKNHTITVLERNQLSAALGEQTLNNFENVNTKDLQNNIRMIPAEYLFLLNKIGNGKNQITELILINCLSGTIQRRIALNSSQILDPEYLDKCIQIFVADSLAVPMKKSKSIAVTLAEIKPELPNESTIGVCRDVNIALPYFLENTSHCIQLSRKQLDYLEIENSIGLENSYWEAAWVVDGSVSQKHGNLQLKLFGTNTKTHSKVFVTESLDELNPTNSIKLAWKKLATQINLPDPSSQKTGDPNFEKNLLASNTEWYLKANYYAEAIQSGRGARFLGYKDKALTSSLLEASLRALPLSIVSVCDHYDKDPRCVEPETKFKLTQHVNQYLDLLDLAQEYVDQTTGPKLRVRDGGRASTYDNIVHQVIHEVAFYRSVLDDSIIYHHYGSHLDLIDKKVLQLLTKYTEKIRGHKKERESLSYFLKDDSHYYLYRYQPEFYKACISQLATLYVSNKHKTYKFNLSGGYIDLAFYATSELSNHYLNKDIWLDALKQYANTGWAVEQPEIYGILAAYASTDQDRDRYTNLGLKAALEHCQAKGGFSDDNLLLLNLHFRPENPVQGDAHGMFDTFHPDIIGQLLTESPEAIVKTAEFKRMWNGYMWLVMLKNCPNETWENNLIRCLDEQNPLLKNSNLTKGDWNSLKAIYVTRKEVSAKVLSMLNKLAGETTKPDPSQQRYDLQLGPPITVPKSYETNGLACYFSAASAVLQGDEVWVTAQYIEHRNTRPETKAFKHCIHVFNLASGEVKTIPVPSDKFRLAHAHRIYPGENYIYYTHSYPGYSGIKFYAIPKNTLQIEEVELPLNILSAVSQKVWGDTICLSLSDTYHTTQSKAINQVVLIEGNKIVKTLVSNRRKPAESPMDLPDTHVTFMDHRADSIRMISHYNLGYINPSKRSCGIYNTKTGEWQKNTRGRLNTLDDEARKNWEAYCRTQPKDAGFRVGDLHCYLFSQWSNQQELQHKGNIKIALKRSVAPYLYGFQQKDYYKADDYYRTLKIKVNPVDHPLFQRASHNIRASQYQDHTEPTLIEKPPYKWKGWWFTPNDLLGRGLFNSHIIGKWKDQYVLTLSQDDGLPGIWLVPEEKIIHATRKALKRNPRPIHFNDASEESRYLNSYAEVSWSKDEVQLIDKLGCEESRCLQILGGEDHSIHIKATDAKLSCTGMKFSAVRWNKEGKLNLRVSIKVNGEWVEVYKNEKVFMVNLKEWYRPNISVEFPSAAQEIKITTSCPDDAWLLIDDIHLN